MSFLAEKNKGQLLETSKTNDLLSTEEEQQELISTIDAVDGVALIGYIGDYGIGKSTILHQIKRGREKNEKWVTFDAWKYPNRDNLWEGFVLDLGSALGGSKAGDKTKKELEGRQNDDFKTLINAIGDIPGAKVLKNFNHFVKTSPAKRVDDVQRILLRRIEETDKNIIIIIEDADRSGDKGLFFLETLSHFLRENKFKQKIRVIAPISKDNYIKNLHLYNKCFDLFEYCEPNITKLKKFIYAFIDNSYLKEEVKAGIGPNRSEGNKGDQITSLFEKLLNEYLEINPRILKSILRNSEKSYLKMKHKNLDPDWRITIMIECLKHVKRKEGPSNVSHQETLFDIIKLSKTLQRGAFGDKKINVFASFLDIIYHDAPDFSFLDRIKNNIEHKFKNDDDSPLPAKSNDLDNGRRIKCFIGDFYLRQ